MLFLLDSERLIWHEAWVFLVLLLVTLVFRASSKAGKDEAPAGRDRLPELIAFFFAGLALDRLLIVGGVAFRIYQPWLVAFWVKIIHLGLFILELSIYILVFYLLKDVIKGRLKSLLRGWLDA